MDNKKILLINLSKGNLGESSSYFLGMLLVGKIALAAYSRSNIPEDQRQDFYLYIDEFQNITTKTIPSILSEARKYRLNLIAAHQFIAQLKDDIRDSIFGNVGNIISFRVGNEDAEYLAKYFTPVFEANDLMNIDNRNAYSKIMINGQPTRPFNIKTIKPDDTDDEYLNEIKKYAIDNYLINKKQAEVNIQNLFNSINQSAKDEKEKAYKEILNKINEQTKND
ncbi:MAG: TraM recognition domain-containing protein [Candidatus Pacebacteria bacterium]|nr:TraM recognition domain-containing protein [Candidatus Paceibacterota bacterium]